MEGHALPLCTPITCKHVDGHPGGPFSGASAALVGSSASVDSQRQVCCCGPRSPDEGGDRHVVEEGSRNDGCGMVKPSDGGGERELEDEGEWARWLLVG